MSNMIISVSWKSLPTIILDHNNVTIKLRSVELVTLLLKLQTHYEIIGRFLNWCCDKKLNTWKRVDVLLLCQDMESASIVSTAPYEHLTYVF